MGDIQTPKRIEWIQTKATDRQILSIWRFELSSSPWLDGAVGAALVERFKSMKERLSTDQWVALSKSVGWEPLPAFQSNEE